MIALRKTHAIFAASQPTIWLDCGYDHVVLFKRQLEQQRVYVAANFSAAPQVIELRRFVECEHTTDLLMDSYYQRGESLTLPPYGLVWLYGTVKQ